MRRRMDPLSCRSPPAATSEKMPAVTNAKGAKKSQGLRYVTRFECIGPRCEDTCCQGWQVFIDEPHFARLKKTLGQTPEGKADFDAHILPRPPAVRSKR